MAMNLDHDETINLIEHLQMWMEVELEDEDDKFSYWDNILLKLYAHSQKLKTTLTETDSSSSYS